MENPNNEPIPVDVPAQATNLSRQYDQAFPVLHRALSLTLLRRAFEATHQANVPTETLQFWHKLLVENSKLPVPGVPILQAPQGTDLIELIWDVFVVPEEERAKRRAAFSLPAPTAGGQQ